MDLPNVAAAGPDSPLQPRTAPGAMVGTPGPASAQNATQRPGGAVSYSSGQACTLTGCSYRMLDHWARDGKLGPGRRTGSGRTRVFEPFEVVLLRACVLISDAVPQAAWAADPDLYAELRSVYRRDPTLSGWRLVIEHGRAFMARSTSAPAALVVNLATCARVVTP